jgi:effector-binding domain-containing protein
MLTEPRIEQRVAQPYVAIRTNVAMSAISQVLPPLIEPVFAWLAARQIAPAGAPFFRYLGMREDGTLDADVGVPVREHVVGDDQVIGDTMPGGTYAVALYIGAYDGIPAATHQFHGWIETNGHPWGLRTGEPPYAAHIEWYITAPNEGDDPSTYETEIAMLVAASRH